MWIAELTINGPGLDGDGTLVGSEGEVEQVDFTVDLGVDDHGVLHGAVRVRQQIVGAVLHVRHYSTTQRQTDVKKTKPVW